MIQTLSRICNVKVAQFHLYIIIGSVKSLAHGEMQSQAKAYEDTHCS